MRRRPPELPCSEEDESAWEAVEAWARSGVMALCGRGGGPPLLPPALSLPARLSGIVEEIERLGSSRVRSGDRAVRLSWEAALAGRAQLLGLRRRGRVSPNGTCRLLTTPDGDVALNLPRPDDIELVPALTETSRAIHDPWEAVTETASRMPAGEFVSRARLLGLAAAVPGERVAEHPYRSTRLAEPRPLATDRSWAVVDLSSLWAGPLAARVLAESGARVIKVEDPARLDGARQNPAFYSWVHPAIEVSARIDFTSSDGRQELSKMLDSADVVIEASRPRALEQIGLSPEQRGIPPGQIWLSITAHGRTGAARDWTGFGDDAAVAGGLICRDLDGTATFCGDAIADPTTGLLAGLAVLRSLREGGGQLIEMSLSDVASWVSGLWGGPPDSDAERVELVERVEQVEQVEGSESGWLVRNGHRSVPVAESPPHLALVRTA